MTDEGAPGIQPWLLMQMWGASHHSGMAAWTGLGFAALMGGLKPAHAGRDLVHGASVFPIPRSAIISVAVAGVYTAYTWACQHTTACLPNLSFTRSAWDVVHADCWLKYIIWLK